MDLTTLSIPDLGGLSLEGIVNGMVSQGPDKYLDYTLYSGYSDFIPRTIGSLNGFDINIANKYSPVQWGYDNGSVAVTAIGTHPDTGLPYFKLSVVDSTGAVDGTTGSHVVSGARYIWFENDTDSGYVMKNMGLSRYLTPQAALINEGSKFIPGYLGESGGGQNANWRAFTEALALKIQGTGGTVNPTFGMSVYRLGDGRSNVMPSIPEREYNRNFNMPR